MKSVKMLRQTFISQPPVNFSTTTHERATKGFYLAFKNVSYLSFVPRRVISNDGSIRKEEKVLTINVKPGWKSGTKITFQREGDQAPNKVPADIIFIIRDKPHNYFKREGSDLKYTCKVTLKEVGLIETFAISSYNSKLPKC